MKLLNYKIYFMELCLMLASKIIKLLMSLCISDNYFLYLKQFCFITPILISTKQDQRLNTFILTENSKTFNLAQNA